MTRDKFETEVTLLCHSLKQVLLGLFDQTPKKELQDFPTSDHLYLGEEADLEFTKKLAEIDAIPKPRPPLMAPDTEPLNWKTAPYSSAKYPVEKL